MKKIGQGWQYTVYDLENGKVLKKFHSWMRAYLVILKEIFPFNNDSLFEIPSFIKDLKQKANESFEILKRKNVPSEWMANPRFLNKYDFEQDKVTPLHDVFKSSSTEEIIKYIDDFIVLNKKLLRIGLIDKSFNITKNYGLDSKGDVVIIDIGELFDDPEKIKNQFKNRAWDKSYVSGNIQNIEAQKYFINEMDKSFLVK